MSNKIDKKEIFDLLNKNEFYAAALKAAPDDLQRRYIKAYTEDFLLNFYEGAFKHIVEAINKDPSALRNAVGQLRDELIKSGSISK